ncbi:hypothetical protein [Bacillus marasmi]|uniref:hypothetical protein n=1 Tax=Bacillus marasmi TaxID=1926279 RepID=UPI0011C9EADA|nr:hypothetical protein [Bacillus marasmi]
MTVQAKNIKRIRKEYVSKLNGIKEDAKKVKEIVNADWYKETGLVNMTKEEFKEWFQARQDEIYAGYLIKLIATTEQALKQVYAEIFNSEVNIDRNIIATIIVRLNRQMNISIPQNEYEQVRKLVHARNTLIHESYSVSAILPEGVSGHTYVKNYIKIYKTTFKQYFKEIENI